MWFVYAFFALLFCVLLYIYSLYFSTLLRVIIIQLRQAVVIRFSKREHVPLLMQLWRQEMLCRRYRDNLELGVVGKTGFIGLQ